MGRGFIFGCRKCGKKFELLMGTGLSYPLVFERTMRLAREGRYGKNTQRYLKEHPDGVLDCERVLMLCPDCGEIGNGLDLSMYIPDESGSFEENGNWSVAVPCEGVPYVSPSDLKDHYRMLTHYNHRCWVCGAKMKVIREEELVQLIEMEYKEKKPTGLRCQECGNPVQQSGGSMWE